MVVFRLVVEVGDPQVCLILPRTQNVALIFLQGEAQYVLAKVEWALRSPRIWIKLSTMVQKEARRGAVALP